ncbi:hypothetical protein L1049_002197 [Liquidambar formosana]|uniref:Uncharacterized protein n=1 Tax=Liquidambar formosana TaxID=63359 RepID=A0AAP0NEG7_LIQFO
MSTEDGWGKAGCEIPVFPDPKEMKREGGDGVELAGRSFDPDRTGFILGPPMAFPPGISTLPMAGGSCIGLTFDVVYGSGQVYYWLALELVGFGMGGVGKMKRYVQFDIINRKFILSSATLDA